MNWEKDKVSAAPEDGDATLGMRSGSAGRGHNRSHPMDDSGKSGKFHTKSLAKDHEPPRLVENNSNKKA
jgi:hypothetical protein